MFWSKNPRPLIPFLPILKHRGIKCYLQFTLNDYPGLERVPVVEQRIETFKEFSQKLGKQAVIWRFDPLMLTKDISIDDLLLKIQRIGNKISKFTEKLVFSYADISQYQKVQHNLQMNKVGGYSLLLVLKKLIYLPMVLSITDVLIVI